MALAFKSASAGDLTAGERQALAAVPGNTAKAHGRAFSTWLFFRFGPDSLDQAKSLAAFIRACRLEGLHTSLLEQLQQWREFQARMAVGDAVPEDDPAVAQPFGSVMLTHLSFSILDTSTAKDRFREFLLSDVAFRSGMVGTRDLLLDVPGSQAEPNPWKDHGFETEFDIALFLARNTREGCDRLVVQAKQLATQHGLIAAHREDGFVWRPGGPGTAMHEAFGFRDGISNLLFLNDDLLAHTKAGGTAWNPKSEWDQVLFLPGEGAGFTAEVESLAGGCFVVLRKLEQNVAAFRAAEVRSGESVDSRVDLGANLVGRTRDGCPMTGLPVSGQLNDFNYDSDDAAAQPRCPFGAHVRKSNPRGRSVEDPANERRTLFVRRGMVYGPNDDLPISRHLETGAGLLFVGYMGSIDQQFVKMHTNWLLKPHFPKINAGLDPVVSPPWMGGFVTPRGGGYFFAPPIPWVENLAV